MITWRRVILVLEATVAAALVVLLHGTAFHTAQRFIQNETPRSAELTLRPANGSDTGEDPHTYRTGHSWIHVTGFAPRHSEVAIAANGVHVGTISIGASPNFSADVDLRPGTNQIEARLLPREDDHRGTNWSRGDARMSVFRIPDTAIPSVLPVLIGQDRNDDGEMRIWGLARPFWVFAYCDPAIPGMHSWVETDALGTFGLYPAPMTHIVFQSIGPRVAKDQGPMAECKPLPNDPTQDVAANYAASLTRNLRIDVHDDKTMQVVATARLPAGSELVNWASSKHIGPYEFLSRMFGLQQLFDGNAPGAARAPITISYVEDGYAELRTWLQFANNEFRLATDTLDFSYEGNSFPKFLSQPTDTLIITLPISEVLQTNAKKSERTASGNQQVLTWRGPMNGHLEASIEHSPESRDGGITTSSERARAKVDKQSAQRSPIYAIDQLRLALPRSVQRIGFQLLLAAPFIWFLLIVRRERIANPDDPQLNALRTFSSGMLLIHAAYALMWLVDADDPIWLVPWFATIDPASVNQVIEDIVRLVTAPFPALLLAAVILYLWIEKLAGAKSGSELGSTRKWKFARWMLCVLAILVTVLAFTIPLAPLSVPARFENTSKATFGYAIVFVPAAVLFGWASIYWLLRIAFFRPPLRIAIVTSLLLLFIPLLPILTDFAIGFLRRYAAANDISPHLLPDDFATLLWTVIASIAGFLVLRSLVSQTLVIAGARPFPSWQDRDRRLASSLLFAILAVPVGVFFKRWADSWLLFDFVGQLTGLFPLLLLCAVYVFLLRDQRSEPFDLPASHLRVGALLFSFYVCGIANLLLVPIPMLLGYWLYLRYLIAPSDPQPLGEAERRNSLARLIALKESEHLLRVFRKNAERKYGDGEMSRDDFENGISLANARVADSATRLGATELDCRRQAFAYGPGDTPLANAWYAVRCGIPLIVLYLAATLDNVVRGRTYMYPFFELALPILTAASYWMVIAFVFGYFYHRLRGHDGPTKGWAYMIALLIPALVTLVLNNERVLGLTAGDRAVRLALFVFSLAIAFDARIVRQSGFGWRELGLVYGGPSTLAYASSLTALGGLSLGPAVGKFACWMMGSFGFQVCTQAVGQ